MIGCRLLRKSYRHTDPALTASAKARLLSNRQTVMAEDIGFSIIVRS